MIPHPDCPPKELLQQLVLGYLPGPELERLATHVEECPHCQSRLERLDDVRDSLIAKLQAPLSETSADPLKRDTDGRHMQQLVERLAEYPPATRTPARDWLQWLREELGTDELRLGSFRVTAVVGVGGMGVVFDAVDERLRRRVAVKVMRPDIATIPQARERFAIEARAMAAVVDPQVAKVFQVGQIGSLPFLAMEFLEGESLSQRLRQGPACSTDEVLRIGTQIALGLAAAHRCGLIHRDIKPENVFLATAAEASGSEAVYHVKLLDFGIVRSTEGANVRSLADDEDWVLGTPAFMSPEQVLGQPVDERTDLFSFGCLLFRLLSGRLPFEGATPRELLQARVTQSPVSMRVVAPQITAELAALVDQLLARDPRRRPQSAGAVARRLSALLPRPRVRRFGRRSLIAAGTAGAVGTALGGWRWWEERQRIEPLDPAWLARVRQLSPREQVAAVVDELRRRNPRWDGRHEWQERQDDVIRFGFDSQYVRDILPLRGFEHLEGLKCVDERSRGTLRDFAPLVGLPLRECDVGYTGLSDLSAFRGMPLITLRSKSTRVKDLGPLANLPLTTLQLAETPVEDLSPIRNCPLRLLSFWGTRVRDLAPLRGLERLERLECEKTLVTDLRPLRGLPIKHLACQQSPIGDYAVLAELPLEELHLTYQPEKHGALLRGIKTLRRINYRDAREFLNHAPVQEQRRG